MVSLFYIADYENDAIITDAPNIVCVITGKLRYLCEKSSAISNHCN